MQAYMGQMMFLYFFVDFLLLLGINQLYGHSPGIGKAALAALYGSIYAGACLLPKTAFLNAVPWRIVSFLCTGILAYGCSAAGIRKGTVYLLLHVVMNSVAQALGERSLQALLPAVCCVFAVFVLVRGVGGRLYIPVELNYGGRKMSLTALRDTGNSLRDPVTGNPVLIVDAVTAEGLTGLSRQQLCSPLETMGAVPGLRLIPYKTVGGTGLLLALRLKDVRIGSWRGSRIVAFSPEVLSADGMYQALTGGIA